MKQVVDIDLQATSLLGRSSTFLLLGASDRNLGSTVKRKVVWDVAVERCEKILAT